MCAKSKQKKYSLGRKISMSLLLLFWVAFGFYAVQFLLMGVIWTLEMAFAELGWQVWHIDKTLLSTLLSAIIYSASLVVIVLTPARLLKLETTKREMGLQQAWPSIRDIGLAPLALLASLILTGIGFFIASHFFEGFNVLQEQQIPFDRGSSYTYLQLLLIFLTLVVFAPIAEELLFRGYLYGKLRRYVSSVTAVLLSSILFGALHLGFGELHELQWNAGINTLALGLCMAVLREYTGSVWSGIILHTIKNFIAFLFLFVVQLPLIGG